MDTYHRWMEVTLYATFAGLPAISVPAGFDASGRLPAGLQLIGRAQGDAALLALAAAHEALSGELAATPSARVALVRRQVKNGTCVIGGAQHDRDVPVREVI